MAMADMEMKDIASEDVSDDASDSNTSDTDTEQVETLVAGRQKRATAANRYDRQRLIEEAEEEVANEQDEVTLLFADDENEEDEEFEGSDEDDGDVVLDSSSDEDDQGPNVQANDLEGEKLLQQEAKAERTKKRKAQLELTTAAGLRKKVRIDPRLLGGEPATPRPTKKKERSFALLDAEGRSRASLRTTTVANKEETQARLIEEEKLRTKLRAKREKKERDRAKDAPPEMTQADRLREAEKVERRNAKSLSRWETMEKKRTEEQAAKLAALKDRKLEGPVITWWSGVAKWVGPKLNQVGLKDPTQDAGSELKKRGRKSKAYHEQLALATQKDAETSATGTPAPSGTPMIAVEDTRRIRHPVDTAVPQITFTTPRGPNDFFLQCIHEYASMPGDMPAHSSSKHADVPSDVSSASLSKPADAPDDVAINLVSKPFDAPGDAPPISSPEPSEIITGQAHVLSSGPPPILLPPAQQTPISGQLLEPPKIENATRNLVILEDFEDLAVQGRGDYGVFYSTRKTARPTKHLSELCPITGLPARYRDPSTGVAYANSFAYRKLQELKRQEHTWSSMLGCYVGRAGMVARGVPEGFLGAP